MREATGLGEAGSLVEVCGRAGSMGLGLLSVLVLGAVAVKRGGLEVLGIAAVSSSDFDDCLPFVLLCGGSVDGAGICFTAGTFGV